MSATIQLTEAALKEKKRQEGIIQTNTETVAREPNNAAAWERLGHAYMYLGKDSEALHKGYLKVIEINPKDVNALYTASMLYDGIGQHQESRKLADTLYSYSPNDFKPNYLKLFQLLEDGKPQEAVPYALTCLNSFPDHPGTNYELGNAYIETGKQEEARKCWEIAVTSNFSSAISYCYRGQCYHKLGKKTEALAQFKTAKEILEGGTTDISTPVQAEYMKKTLRAVLEAEEVSERAEVELKTFKTLQKADTNPVLKKLAERVKNLQAEQKEVQDKVMDKLDKPQSEETKKNVSELDRLKEEFNQQLAEMKAAMAQMQNKVEVIDQRVTKVENSLEQMQEELDNKLDDFKKKLDKELDKGDLPAEDKVKIQGYFKAFLGTFSSAFVTAEVVDSGQVQIDAGSSATTILSMLASFTPFVGSVLESGIKTVGEFLKSKEMKTSAKTMKGLAADASELSQLIGKVGYELALNKDQQKRIVSTTEQDLEEISGNLFRKIVKFCENMDEKIDKFLYTKLYKTPAERVGHNDANLLIEKWIKSEITPFNLEEQLIKSVIRQNEGGNKGRNSQGSNTQEVQNTGNRTACCNMF